MLQDSPTCFLATPATDEFAGIRQLAHDVLAAYGIELVSAAESPTTTPIFDFVIERLKRADMMIADITGLNPNVLFELGVGFALRKQLLIVSRSGQNVPFNISGLRIVFYKPEDTEKLEHFMRYWVKESMTQAMSAS